MTVQSPSTARRAQMSTEDFEQVARTAPETVKFEFINGRVEVKPMSDQLHKAMIMWLLTQCMRQRPELLIDRDTEELVLYSDPREGVYESRTLHALGATVKLPDPVLITLETEKLKDYTR
ncbi:hypothetical protein ACIOJD_26515 [Streptomyces sp. NPDC088116]|uniref:hypothetical protein n=1 Tax=Streptomyces sp. NPDC088116 TaxID=3365825 RepID=UPI0037F9F1F1